jgi:hypothetical protein
MVAVLVLVVVAAVGQGVIWLVDVQVLVAA